MREQGYAVRSEYFRLKKQAVKTLYETRKQIRFCETELAKLRAEKKQINLLLGRPARDKLVKEAPGSRTDWERAVLWKLPKEFTASEIRKLAVVSEKHPSEVFHAITRWIKSKAVKRKSRGLYERIR